MNGDILLRAEGIDKSFFGTPVLKNVNLEIKRGEVHALMGENGAGKSTLIKILTGVYPKDAGIVYYNRREVGASFSRHDARELGMAVIYQELSLIPTLTVTQNILLGQEIADFGVLMNRQCEKGSRSYELLRVFNQSRCRRGNIKYSPTADDRNPEGISL